MATLNLTITKVRKRVKIQILISLDIRLIEIVHIRKTPNMRIRNLLILLNNENLMRKILLFKIQNQLRKMIKSIHMKTATHIHFLNHTKEKKVLSTQAKEVIRDKIAVIVLPVMDQHTANWFHKHLVLILEIFNKINKKLSNPILNLTVQLMNQI